MPLGALPHAAAGIAQPDAAIELHANDRAKVCTTCHKSKALEYFMAKEKTLATCQECREKKKRNLENSKMKAFAAAKLVQQLKADIHLEQQVLTSLENRNACNQSASTDPANTTCSDREGMKQKEHNWNGALRRCTTCHVEQPLECFQGEHKPSLATCKDCRGAKKRKRLEAKIEVFDSHPAGGRLALPACCCP